MSNLIGKSLGRYHINEQLGEGGMAIVYKAYDTRLETDVAVKVIRTENLAPSILQNALLRFEREAKSLAKLTHSNIVKVLDYGQYEDMPWLVMPYLPGGTLKQKLTGVPMAYQEAARLLIPIARALAYAHQQGMVHRDVKPSNILITHSGDPMLTDFGIAKIIGNEVTQDLTGTSATIGTPEYMAPEQASSKDVDHRADIYSLGIVLFEMVTGRRPYQADTPMAVLLKHMSAPLPSPRSFAPGLPDVVEHVLVKALAKNPDDRYQSMDDFAAALERLARGDLSVTGSVATVGGRKKEFTQAATLVENPPTRGQVGGTVQATRSARTTSSNTTRILAFGAGFVGIVVVGICILGALYFLLRDTSSPSAPEPTALIPYVAPTAVPPAVQPTQPPPNSPGDLPTIPPVIPTLVVIQPTNPPSPTATPSCPRAKYPTQLKADRDAYICTQSERVIVRRAADMSADEIFSLYPDTTIRILEGPVCADDFWWWKIEIYANTIYGKQGSSRTWTTTKSVFGWAREGWDDKDPYFICQ
jgi:serine/threonine protein kinase